jgi:hypothetical protein
MVPIIEKLLSIAKTLLGFKDELEKSRRERRDRIATYFEAISMCLSEVADKLRAGDVPHGRCAELGTYAAQLPATIGDEIGDAEAQRLAQQLDSAHEVELLLNQLGQSTDRDAQMAKLDEASGIFKALAASIRAAR